MSEIFDLFCLDFLTMLCSSRQSNHGGLNKNAFFLNEAAQQVVLIEHNMCVRVRQKYPKWYGLTALGHECLKSADVSCILNGTQRGFGEALRERIQVRCLHSRRRLAQTVF